MDRVEGIDVVSEDKAAWDAAVAAFEKARRVIIARQNFAAEGGALVEPIPVLGAAESGLDGSRAVLA